MAQPPATNFMKALRHFANRHCFAHAPHEEGVLIATTRRLSGWLRSLIVLAAFVLLPWQARAGLGLTNTLVVDMAPSAEAFPLAVSGVAAPLWIDTNDWAGVQRAAGDLRLDVQRVTGLLPVISSAPAGSPPSARPVIIGTVGKSAIIDSLIAAGKLTTNDLTGRWEVAITYSASRTTHTLQLQQRGNRLEGLHQGDFLSRDISGTVNGDAVSLASVVTERHGDALTYRFRGTVSGDTIAGSLDMGEYLGATWAARRPGERA